MSESVRAHRSGRGPAAGIWLVAAALVAGAAGAVRALDFNPLGLLASTFTQTLVLLLAAAATGAAWRLRRRDLVWPHVPVAATAVLTAVVLVISVAKTPFGLGGLHADQSFRSAAMTRYALTALPVDFGYRGHGTSVPPLWYWLAGRAAAWADLDGWQAMKWAQIVTAFAVPLVAYLWWRRVAGPAPAALVTVLGVLAVPDPVKGEEWLSLVVMLPWWLDAFADVRAAGAARWPAWAHGIVAGLMLSLYTAFFLPAAVATLVVAGQAVRARRWRPLLRRWLGLVGSGLLVWAWVWIPAAYERLTGGPYRLFQLSWFGDTSPVPPPLELSLTGVLAAAGVATLAWWAAADRALRWHAVFAGSVLVVMVAGLLAAVAGHPILVQKTYPMLRYVLVSAAGLGGWALWSARRSGAGPVRRRQLFGLGLAAVLTVSVTLGLDYVLRTVRAEAMPQAYAQPDPNGRLSRHSPAEPPGTPAEQVIGVLGRDRRAVVLSDRYDLFVFGGYWNFNQFTASYAHPHSDFLGRVALIERLAATQDPAAAHRLLRANPYEPIDAVVLSRGRDQGLRYRYRAQDYPRGTVPTTIEFAPAAFADARLFAVTELPGCVVIRPRTEP